MIMLHEQKAFFEAFRLRTAPCQKLDFGWTQETKACLPKIILYDATIKNVTIIHLPPLRITYHAMPEGTGQALCSEKNKQCNL